MWLFILPQFIQDHVMNSMKMFMFFWIIYISMRVYTWFTDTTEIGIMYVLHSFTIDLIEYQIQNEFK